MMLIFKRMALVKIYDSDIKSTFSQRWLVVVHYVGSK